MPYRQLSHNEIIQLGHELEDLARWEGARDFVSALYGLEPRKPTGLAPHQLTLLVVTVPMPHHQGYEETAEIVVADQENQIMSFDLARYWWAQFPLSADDIATIQADTSGGIERMRGLLEGSVYDALRDLCSALLGVSFHAHPQPQAPITFTYIIDTPPSVSLHAVYAAEK